MDLRNKSRVNSITYNHLWMAIDAAFNPQLYFNNAIIFNKHPSNSISDLQKNCSRTNKLFGSKEKTFDVKPMSLCLKCFRWFDLIQHIYNGFDWIWTKTCHIVAVTAAGGDDTNRRKPIYPVYTNFDDEKTGKRTKVCDDWKIKETAAKTGWLLLERR